VREKLHNEFGHTNSVWDFPDNNRTPDHRPVRATFELSGTTPVSRQEILDRINELKLNIEELERMVNRLP